MSTGTIDGASIEAAATAAAVFHGTTTESITTFLKATCSGITKNGNNVQLKICLPHTSVSASDTTLTFGEGGVEINGVDAKWKFSAVCGRQLF